MLVPCSLQRLRLVRSFLISAIITTSTPVFLPCLSPISCPSRSLPKPVDLLSSYPTQSAMRLPHLRQFLFLNTPLTAFFIKPSYNPPPQITKLLLLPRLDSVFPPPSFSSARADQSAIAIVSRSRSWKMHVHANRSSRSCRRSMCVN